MAHTAAEIYFELIARIKKKVRSEISVVFDPETGIQKYFLKGKLLGIKKVRDVKETKPKGDNL